MGIHVDDRVPARPPESELRGAVRGETVWEEPTASRKEARAEPGGPSEEELTGDQLLRLHSRDLIDRLQSWEGTLDAREANLNAREAALERRQRQFRTQRHQWIEELAEQRRKLERIRRQIDAHARRLAFDAA